MAAFLTTAGIVASIDAIIREAQQKIVLMSPYIQVSEYIRTRLLDADRRGCPITLVYGKESLATGESEWLRQLQRLSLYYCEHLHAKCYFNERQMVICSLNLYQFSSNTNREMGVLIASDDVAYRHAVGEAEEILRGARHEPIREKSVALPLRGHCVRCGRGVRADPERPLCRSCYDIWHQFGDPDYRENFCHACGTASDVSVSRPLCTPCYRRVMDRERRGSSAY